MNNLILLLKMDSYIIKCWLSSNLCVVKKINLKLFLNTIIGFLIVSFSFGQGGTKSLTIDYPNGGEFWEVAKTPYISWQSQNIISANVLLEFTVDNGVTWLNIATVPTNTGKYNWTIPSNISTQCLVRITADGLEDISDANFLIISNDNIIYKIVVLGSSTAAGDGPSDPNNAWVSRYSDFLTQKDTRYVVDNFAVGGFVTYNILPDDTIIPPEVTETIDTQKNITRALALNPNGIIINLPSNDSAKGYLTADQIANYHLIRDTAIAQSIPVWISSPQPRDFVSNPTALNIQLEMVSEMPIQFGGFVLDFWADLGVSGGNGIDPLYDSGDGIHLNDAGHKILFDRVVAKDIHTTVKNLVDATLSIDSDFVETNLKIYPNPFNEKLTIDYNFKFNSSLKIRIFDIRGRLLKTLMSEEKPVGKGSIAWSPNDNNYSKGMYIFRITTNNNIITKKIIFN
jgi:lysophospholipase L1-like esterase